jgi:hypothetical protein
MRRNTLMSLSFAFSKIALDVGLGRRIIGFHKSRHIEPQHGCIKPLAKFINRWRFSDSDTASAFKEQFGGEVLNIKNAKSRWS